MKPHRLFAVVLLTLAVSIADAAGTTSAADVDPLGSPRWGDMRKQFFAGAKVVFDNRVKVAAPEVAEDPLNVPVTVDAAALADVETVLVFADFNPILRALAFTPRASLPYLGFRLKLQQSSPVRAAARTADGVWHVGGTLVTTTGGGCTVPSTGSASPEWQQHLGEVSSRIWRENQDSRLRLRIIHPMDTGLSGTVPAFYLQQIDIKDGQGQTLMTIEPHEPVSENPVFTLRLSQRNGERLQVQGRDNNGNRFQAWVEQ